MTPEIITATHAEQAGHWYTRDGKPAYTIIGKNGKERPTTLRDARKLNLLPSVTTILNDGAKPGLETWKQKQVLMASLTLPHIDGETDDAWMERILADSKEEGKKAAERGTQIHAWIQQWLEGKGVLPEARPYCEAVQKALEHEGIDLGLLAVEESFSTDRFGGKVDIHRRYLTELVLDAKTKETPEKFGLYDDHAKQLAAYREGLGMPAARCGIIFASINPIVAEVQWIPEPKLQRGWRMFQALLEHWYARTGLGEEA